MKGLLHRIKYLLSDDHCCCCCGCCNCEGCRGACNVKSRRGRPKKKKD